MQAEWSSFHFSCYLYNKKKSRNLHCTHVCNVSRGQLWHLMWFQNCRSSPSRPLLLGRKYLFPAWNKTRCKHGTCGCCKEETMYHIVHYLGLINIHSPGILTNLQMGLPHLDWKNEKHDKSLLKWSSHNISDLFPHTPVVWMVQKKGKLSIQLCAFQSWNLAPPHYDPALAIVCSY